MKILTIALFALFIAGCAQLYHPKYGNVGPDNKFLEADIADCSKNVKLDDSASSNAKVEACLKKKGWEF